MNRELVYLKLYPVVTGGAQENEVAGAFRVLFPWVAFLPYLLQGTSLFLMSIYFPQPKRLEEH